MSSRHLVLKRHAEQARPRPLIFIFKVFALKGFRHDLGTQVAPPQWYAHGSGFSHYIAVLPVKKIYIVINLVRFRLLRRPGFAAVSGVQYR